MICSICGREFSFFQEGVYCSSECAEKAVKELEDLLESMKQEDEKFKSSLNLYDSKTVKVKNTHQSNGGEKR